MKLQILHGPAIASSRKKLTEIKSKFDPDNILVFEKGSDIKDILASLQTVSMFDENRLVVIENPSDDLLNKLSIINYQLSIVLWFDKEVDSKKLSKEMEVLFFPEAKEASIFPLLDLLGNRSSKAFVELKKTRPNGSDTQYIFTMIFYLLRSLLVAPKNAPPFIKQKLAKQRSNFSKEELVNLYKYILETDFKIKKGLIETTQAEFQIINKFIVI